MNARDSKAIARRRKDAPMIECGCGCGQQTKALGLSGRPVRFIKNHDKRLLNRSGSAHPRWKGGVNATRSGYVRVWLSPIEAISHPTAYKHGAVGGWTITRSHLVWNTHHPDDLVQQGEHVHHVNHVRSDDRLANLAKMDGVTHARLHGLKAI